MASTRSSTAYDVASSKVITNITIGNNMNVAISPITSPAATVKRTDTKEHLITFPYKLHEMLEYACDSASNSACSWTADGTAFVIVDKDLMMEELVPKFFRQTKFRSFTRQLNLWGFVRHGTMWRHTLGLFHRERTHLLDQMHRNAVKSRGPSTAAKSCNSRAISFSSPTNTCDGETSNSQFPITPTPVAVGSVFDYFSKPATIPSAQEAIALTAELSKSYSSDETATTQESADTKSQSHDEAHEGADNALSCANDDDLLCLAASLFERNEEEEDIKDIPSTRRSKTT